MTRTIQSGLRAGAAVLCLALGGLPDAALATEGYFALGFGPVQRAQGGAGVAHAFDAMSATVNPAAVAGLGTELSMGVEVFAPRRGYEGTATGFVPSGNVQSGRDLFLIPNFALNHRLDGGAVLNFAAYGNGGMNTSYPAGLAGCGSVYCGGPAGVDLSQLFLSATYARQDGNLSWGIAPTLAVQRFEARGLGAFAGISTNPAALTDRGHDTSYGFGLRAGLQYKLSDQLTFGLSGQTKIGMSKFKTYAGLFENGGDFDIPATVTAGLAWKATQDLTVMLDYQKIWYSDVGAIGNANSAGPLGAKGGAGFGWDDVNVVHLGAEWRSSPEMIWRAGYAHASNPVGPEDVTLNIIAPGIVQDHFTFGGSRQLNDRDRLDFSVVYVPRNTVTGPEMTPLGPTGGSVKLKMNQVSVSIGWSRKF
ncbi:OmpP1/FadL family transporter [Thioclava sp. FR2]|uniref:OmpP1/FadL family transporter n=1 Tax=Thioclava sp. FR2 TaxID=3445780 RepID=UPI003EBEB1B3